MLENWLQTPKIAAETWEDWQFGTHTLQHQARQFPDLKKAKIALIGVNTEVDIIRQYLYAMSYPFGDLPIADIGNLRNPTEEMLLPVIRELLNSKIIPVIISAEATPFLAQYKAYQERFKRINIALVNEKMSDHKNNYAFLSVLRKVKKPKLGNLAFIGYQGHLCPTKTIRYYQKKNYDCFRLGLAKANMKAVEPIIRDAHSLYFHATALKQTEAPGTYDNSPSGFTSEEACQICHYAGINDKLSSIGFYGYNPSKDVEDQTAKVLAQMIWYFLKGVHQRKKDFPVSKNQMIEYIVAFKDHDYDLVFWKSEKSGRWWLEQATKNPKNNYLVPCSYEDYQLAGQGELSDHLLNILERFSR